MRTGRRIALRGVQSRARRRGVSDGIRGVNELVDFREPAGKYRATKNNARRPLGSACRHIQMSGDGMDQLLSNTDLEYRPSEASPDAQDSMQARSPAAVRIDDPVRRGPRKSRLNAPERRSIHSERRPRTRVTGPRTKRNSQSIHASMQSVRRNKQPRCSRTSGAEHSDDGERHMPQPLLAAMKSGWVVKDRKTVRTKS